MLIKKTRNEGGSTVVVIPRVFCRELGITPGDYITFRTDRAGHLILGKVEEYSAYVTRPDKRPR